MPIKNGLKTATEIRSKFPSARIILLTACEGNDEINEALQAGALGYVLKNTAGEILIAALRAVVAASVGFPKKLPTGLVHDQSGRIQQADWQRVFEAVAQSRFWFQ